MSRKKISGKTVTLKIKYHDFRQITRSATIDEATNSGEVMMNEVLRLLKFTEAGTKKIRLLGISLSGLDCGNDEFHERQLLLPFRECG